MEHYLKLSAWNVEIYAKTMTVPFVQLYWEKGKGQHETRQSVHDLEINYVICLHSKDVFV